MSDSESGVPVIKSIRVSSTRTVLNVVYYEIETIFTTGRKSVILSRFREFDELNKRIRADYKLKYKHLYDNIPEFPTKSPLGFLEKQTSDTFINQRKEQLEIYLQKLAKLPHALENKDFIDFINRSVGAGDGTESLSSPSSNSQNGSKAAAPDFATPTDSASSSSSSSASSTSSPSNASASVGATTSSTGTVFLSRGFSNGTHPATVTKAAPSKPAPPKSAAPASAPAAKTESKEEEHKPAAPASPTAKETTQYKTVDTGKPQQQDSSVLGQIGSIGSSLKNSFGSIFGKKGGSKSDVHDTVKNENL